VKGLGKGDAPYKKGIKPGEIRRNAAKKRMSPRQNSSHADLGGRGDAAKRKEKTKTDPERFFEKGTSQTPGGGLPEARKTTPGKQKSHGEDRAGENH